MRSINDEARVKILENGLLFEVEYPLKLDYKKPDWIFEEGKEGVERKMKMLYQHVILKQTFSIS